MRATAIVFVLLGSGTALADQPSLTVRDVAEPPEHPPLRVLLNADVPKARTPCVSSNAAQLG